MNQKIIITIGDPYGVGPEVISKIWNYLESLNKEILILGSKKSLDYYCRKQGLLLDKKNVSHIEVNSLIKDDWSKEKVGQDNAEGGQVSFLYVKEAVSLLKREGGILVTGPISKTAWLKAGVPYYGHTDFFEKTVNRMAKMLFYSPSYLLGLVTHHVPLKSVPSLISIEKIKQTILCVNNLKGLIKESQKKWRIAICGLNPHASDGGIMGKEEEELIVPAIQELKKEGIIVEGPCSPDALFVPHRIKELSAVVAMYHDQGLIPFKAQAFHEGVNFTVNLPFIRTSPDHGTAFDIAGKGMVCEKSFLNAVDLAVRLKEIELKKKVDQ